MGLLVAGFLFGQRLERKAEAQGFETVETDRFAFQLGGAAQGWEAFLDPRWEQLLADRLARLDDFLADDPEGPLRVADALAELSFIEELGAPHVIWPDGIEVPLKLRRPVACVAWRGAFYPVAVDWQGEGGPRGVLLPGASSTPPAFGGGYLPVLGGVTGRLDGVWLEEPSLVAALSVADSMWYELDAEGVDRLGRVVIDATRDREASIEEPGTRLELEGGRIVYWGRSPAIGAAGERASADKWRDLSAALALLDPGATDPVRDWTLVDLRWDDSPITWR